MKIRLLGECGIEYEGHRNPGEVFEVDEAFGWGLLGSGRAEAVEPPTSTPITLATHADPKVMRRR